MVGAISVEELISIDTDTRPTVKDALRDLWAERALLRRSVLAEARALYAGTALGVFWFVFGPILLLGLYSLIYAVIFRVRIPDFTVEEYIINVFSGLVPFLAFANALSSSTAALRKDQKLLLSSFPPEYIPIRAVLVSYIMLLVGLILVFAGDALLSKPAWTLLLVPVVAVLQLMLSVGLGMILSVIALVIKDIQFLIQYIVIALLIVTPIAYTPSMIPPQLSFLMYANPLFYYINSYQNLILLNEFPNMNIIIGSVIIALASFFFGLFLFVRARPVLNELL